MRQPDPKNPQTGEKFYCKPVIFNDTIKHIEIIEANGFEDTEGNKLFRSKIVGEKTDELSYFWSGIKLFATEKDALKSQLEDIIELQKEETATYNDTMKAFQDVINNIEKELGE